MVKSAGENGNILETLHHFPPHILLCVGLPHKVPIIQRFVALRQNLLKVQGLLSAFARLCSICVNIKNKDINEFFLPVVVRSKNISP